MVDILVHNDRKLRRINWIPDLLFKSSEAWLVDDLSSFEICLIGMIAHVNAVFRDHITKELASYRSPALFGKLPFANNLYETRFGKASIESHFRTLDSYEMSAILSLCCRTGPASMMKLLIDIGVCVLIDDGFGEVLGQAAAVGNMEFVYMLLEAGANSSKAFDFFLPCSDHLSDTRFKRILEILVEKARPASLTQSHNDPLLAVIKSSRALHFHPKAPEILLNRQIFNDEGFGKWRTRVYFEHSYMYQAISRGNSFVVDLLLQDGAHANAQISHSFTCHGKWFEQCTWITFSVMRGAASCADVLIRHGADVTALDGAGRSAIQLAKMNALSSHPRSLDIFNIYGFTVSVSDEEDAETLAVVEKAFNLKFQGLMTLEEYDKSSNEMTLRPLPQQSRPVSALQRILAKVLGIVFTPTRIRLLHDSLRGLYHDIRKVWCLSFYEALLMRSICVLSYALLLALELHAFIKGHKRITMPSRSFLSAIALLLLALVWGSSQMGLSWDSITA